MWPLQSSGGTTRKQLALGRETLCNIQSLQIFRPSSSMFPEICATTASLSEPAKVGDSHTVPARSPSVGIPSKTIWLPGIKFATLGVSSAGRLGPNPYHTSPKVTNYPQIKSPLHFYGTPGLLPLINLFLGYLLTPTTRTLTPWRQHTPLHLLLQYS